MIKEFADTVKKYEPEVLVNPIIILIVDMARYVRVSTKESTGSDQLADEAVERYFDKLREEGFLIDDELEAL